MSLSIIHLGLDVHKDSITVAVLPGDARSRSRGRLLRQFDLERRLPMQLDHGGAPRAAEVRLLTRDE